MSVMVIACACGPTTRNELPDATAAESDAATQQDAPPQQASGPVDVVITADNAYSFGYGTVGGITTFIQGTRAQTAGQIFNCGEGPERYTVPAADAPDSAYLYIVTWDDLSVTQGVLAQFSRDSGTVLTGDDRFEVCATGVDFSDGPSAQTGPGQIAINDEIARCNAASGAAATTSHGWVNTNGAATTGAVGRLAVGEANDAQTGTFPLVCQPDPANPTQPGIESSAHWMWYDPMDGGGDAFHSTGANRFKAFLIFRLSAGAIIL